jgi:hypothetical protein
MHHARTIASALLLTCLLLTACQGGPYTIRGRAVEGTFSSVEFVDAEYVGLNGRGVPGAKIIIVRDGDKGWAKHVAEARSSGDGTIEIPIQEFGAGWMIEQWLVQVERPGYQTTEALLSFPEAKEGKQLLVTLAPGPSIPLRSKDELMEQYEQFR